MPVSPTYPGVYIEEIPSGVRTITGVATSITAFIGRALRGPVNKAVTINNYGDFERIFGGLWVDCTLGNAVRDYYLNGGRQAIIVRLFNPSYANDDERKKAEDAAQAVADAVAGTDAVAAAAAARTKASTFANEPEKNAADAVAKKAEAAAHVNGATADSVKAVAKAAAKRAKARLSIQQIKLAAAYEGQWGANLRATIDTNVAQDVADRMGLAKTDLFNLTVRDSGPGGITERFINLSVKPSSRRIDKVLEAESKLVRWDGAWVTDPLPTFAAGEDAVTTAKTDLTAKKKALADLEKANPPDNTAINSAKTAVTSAEKAVAEATQAMGGSDGSYLEQNDFTGPGKRVAKQGLYGLEQADLFNLLCLPPYLTDGNIDASLISDAVAYCKDRRAMLLIDPPTSWNDKDTAKIGIDTEVGDANQNAAIFFPRLRQPNPLRNNQPEDFVPCGAVAGVFARTDTERGVWKAPAGFDASLIGVPQLSVNLTDDENGELNPLGINCLRAMPAAGRVVWGARTRLGDDRLASEWKYIPVRRMALFIEESLYRGTKWVVFEPNDEPLWAQIRLNVGAFMHNLFRQGAFQGTTPREAYFVKCDKETTTQNDINLGIVNIVVGFAPLKPAEFVIIKLQQMAGQIEV